MKRRSCETGETQRRRNNFIMVHQQRVMSRSCATSETPCHQNNFIMVHQQQPRASLSPPSTLSSQPRLWRIRRHIPATPFPAPLLSLGCNFLPYTTNFLPHGRQQRSRLWRGCKVAVVGGGAPPPQTRPSRVDAISSRGGPRTASSPLEAPWETSLHVHKRHRHLAATHDTRCVP